MPTPDDVLTIRTPTSTIVRVAVPITPQTQTIRFTYSAIPTQAEYFGNVLEHTQSRGAPGYAIYATGDAFGFTQPGFSLDAATRTITLDLTKIRTLAPFKFGFTTDLVNFGLSTPNPNASISISQYTTSVPEPSTAAVAGAGGVAALGVRVRRRRG